MEIFNSTKTRLTAWFVGVLAVMMVVFSFGFYFLFESTLLNQTDSTLTEIAIAFENSVAIEMNDQEVEQEGKTVSEAIVDSIAEVSFRNYALVVISNSNKLITEGRGTNQIAGVSANEALKWLENFRDRNEPLTETVKSGNESFRVALRPFNVRGEQFYLLVIHPVHETENLLQKIRYAFLIIVPMALFFALIGGYFLVRKSLAPIKEMSQKAEEITAMNLHERLPIQNEEDELGRLAVTFNRLLARLNLSFEQQQRFIADASHELRTPVAIVRGEAEVSLTKPKRSSAEYRETIDIIQTEAERMSIIIEDLFTLTRADAGENPVYKVEIDLVELLAAEIKAFRTLAAKRGIEIELEAKGNMSIFADIQLFQRLFSNLIDNAVKHSKSTVKITAKDEIKTIRIEFADDGNGIPEESQPYIFDRFFRADKIRSRQIGPAKGSGAGLGLSIAKWIVEMHQGQIELSKSNREGSIFTIIFPKLK